MGQTVRVDSNGFVAELVTVGPLDDGVEHVGWASTRDGDGPHLILLRGVEDVEVCIVSGEEQTYGTHYGGVVSVCVHAMESILELTDDAAAALGTDPLIVVRHDPPISDPASVQSRADTLLAGER